MNFIAIIGIVDTLKKSKSNINHTLRIKVEKPFLETNDEEWYDIVDVNLDKETFRDEFEYIARGSIIGVKGHVKRINEQMHLIGERVQVF